MTSLRRGAWGCAGATREQRGGRPVVSQRRARIKFTARAARAAMTVRRLPSRSMMVGGRCISPPSLLKCTLFEVFIKCLYAQPAEACVLTPVCITSVLSLDGLMQSEQIYTLRTMRPPRCRPNQHTHLERPRDGTEAALYLSLFSSALDKLFLYRRPPSKISGSHDTPRAQREDTVGQQARGAPKSQRRVCKCPFCEYNIFQKENPTTTTGPIKFIRATAARD